MMCHRHEVARLIDWTLQDRGKVDAISWFIGGSPASDKPFVQSGAGVSGEGFLARYFGSPRCLTYDEHIATIPTIKAWRRFVKWAHKRSANRALINPVM